jgi:hypothetical protein
VPGRRLTAKLESKISKLKDRMMSTSTNIPKPVLDKMPWVLALWIMKLRMAKKETKGKNQKVFEKKSVEGMQSLRNEGTTTRKDANGI